MFASLGVPSLRILAWNITFASILIVPLLSKAQNKGALPFDQNCNGKDQSLNQQIETHIVKGMRSPSEMYRFYQSQPIRIDRSCILSGMKKSFWQDSKRFAQCKTAEQDTSIVINGKNHVIKEGSSYITKADAPPCLTETYVKSAEQILGSTLYCLKDFMIRKNGKFNPDVSHENMEQIKAMTAVIKRESGFHLHALSHSGAAGMGQITDPAIQHANQSSKIDKGDIKSMEKYLAGHDIPECRSILETLAPLTPIKSGLAGRCGRIDVAANNPLTNLLYAIANVAANYRMMDDSLLKNGEYSFLFEGLDKEDQVKMRAAIPAWMHNVGYGDFNGGLNNVVIGGQINSGESLGQPAPPHFSKLTFDQRIDRIAEGIKKHMKTPHPSRKPYDDKRVEEAGNYYKALRSDFEKTESSKKRQAEEHFAGKCVRIDEMAGLIGRSSTTNTNDRPPGTR